MKGERTGRAAALALAIDIIAHVRVSAFAEALRLEINFRHWIIRSSSARHKDEGKLIVTGAISGDTVPDAIEVELSGTPSFGALSKVPQTISFDSRASKFHGELSVPCGRMGIF